MAPRLNPGCIRQLLAVLLSLVGLTARASVEGEQDVLLTRPQLIRLSQMARPDDIQRLLAEIGQLGNRMPGEEGFARMADWLEAELSTMGFTILGRQNFTVTSPRDTGSTVTCQLAGNTYRLRVHAMWPNQVTPPFIPEDGLTARLVDGGDGTLADFDGKPIAPSGDSPGAIVMMPYASGQRWLNAAAIGASAVIFLPDDDGSFVETRAKSADTPIQFARFYVSSATDAAILRQAAAEQGMVTLEGGSVWTAHPASNLVALLPATQPTADAPVETILVGFNFDDASLVPSFAPGGISASNLATAITTLRTLTDPELGLARQHHLLVVADSGRMMAMTGLQEFADIVRDLNASRRQEWARSGRPLTPRQQFVVRKMADIEPWMDDWHESLSIRLGRMTAAVAWLEAGGAEPFAYRDVTPVTRTELIAVSEAGQWFEQLVTDLVKEQQIAVLNETARAERAADADQFTATEALPAEAQTWRRRKDHYRHVTAAGTTIDLLRRMREQPLAAADVGPDDITEAALLARFQHRRGELEKELAELESALALRAKLADLDITRAIMLDISAGDSVLTAERGRMGGDRASPAPQIFEWHNALRPILWRNLEHIAIVANYLLAEEADSAPAVSPAFSFIGEGDQRRSVAPAPSGDLSLHLGLAGVTGYSLITGNDNRLNRLGPGDRLPSTPDELRNLSMQSRTAALLLAHVLQQPGLLPHYEKNTPWVIDVNGSVVKQDVRAGPFPKLPVPGALVVLTGGESDASSAFTGSVLNSRYELADSQGNFRFAGVAGGQGKAQLTGYGFSVRNGMLACAPDTAMASRGGFETSFGLLDRNVFKRVVVFEGACVQVHNAIDPMLVQALAVPGMADTRLIEGRGGGLDKYYLFSPHARSSVLVALVPRDTRLKLAIGLGGFGNRMLLLGNQENSATGEGHAVGDGLDLVNADQLAAEALWRLNDSRLTKLRSKGVRANIATQLHEQATADRDLLATALAERSYSRASYITRNIWGRELKAYPEILSTTNEAVIAVLILLAFMAPWALFMERVFLQAGSILGRIGGALGFFAAAFLLIYVLHPAFQISQTPIMILVAYALATLAILALAVLLSKYTAVMKRWRERVGGVHQSDISRAGAFMVAFSLGLSNMARRRLRTVLTIVMIALLSFSVMTFTSIEPYQTTRRIPVSTVNRVPYDGLLFRLYNFAPIAPQTADSFIQDVGPGTEAVKRAWYMRLEPGALLGPGGQGSRIQFTREANGTAAARHHTANVLLGFMPAEPRFSALRDCVTGEWFSGAGDEVILPAAAAAALGITALDVRGVAVSELPRVILGNRPLRVIGILDAEAADTIVGLGGRNLSQVDFFLSGIAAAAGPKEDPKALTLPVGDEVDVTMVPFANTALLPYETLITMGGQITSVTVRFLDGVDSSARIDDLMGRFAMNLYAAIDGRPYLVKTATSQSVSGLWKILLPLLLVVLIMVNLMLGTVDERQEEIKMLGAVGLAPRHVTILYLAESCCLGIMGIVFGVLTGLAVSLATRGLNVGVDVNYASVPTMLIGVVMLGVIVLSTLIPAGRAARLATPSGAEEWSLPEQTDGHAVLRLPFTMTRENGVGIFAFLHEYLNGHWESTSPDFRCASLEARIHHLSADETALAIAAQVWLAPYDMRAAQSLQLRLEPEAGDTLFSVTYDSRQTSGELTAWQRGNFAFIDLLRQQFLIYRTLDEERKNRYVKQAASLFQTDPPSETGQPAPEQDHHG